MKYELTRIKTIQIKDESSQHGIKRKKSYEPLEVEDQVSL